MTITPLVDEYFDKHGGKSSYIDTHLRLVEQSWKDANRNTERGDNDFAVANIAIARGVITNLIEVITPFSAFLRAELMPIYLAIDNHLCDLQDISKK